MGFEGITYTAEQTQVIRTPNGFSGISVGLDDTIVNNYAFDMVAQYNYAKTTIVSANNGLLINYTDAELGIIDPYSQSTFKNFYDLSLTSNYNALHLQDGNYSTAPSVTSPDAMSNFDGRKSTVYFDFYFDDNPKEQDNRAFTSSDTVFVGTKPLLFVKLAGNAINLGTETETVFGNTISILLGTYDASKNKRLTGIISFDADGNTSIYAKYDGNVYSLEEVSTINTSYTNFNLALNTSANFGTNAGTIWNRCIADAQYYNLANIQDIVENNNFSLLQDVIIHYNFLNPTQGKNIFDFSFNGFDTIVTNYIENSYHQLVVENSNTIKEKLFTIRQKALYFDKSQKQYLRIAGFDPPGTNGYTYVVGWKFAESRSFSDSYEDMFISKRENGANQTVLLYGIGNRIQYTATSTTKSDVEHTPTVVNYESGFNFCVLTCSDDISRSIYTNDIAKTNNQAGEVKGLDEMVGQIFHIGSDGAESGLWSSNQRFYDGYMFYFAVWTRILSDKEIYELQNNLLFNNPTTEQQQDLELFIDFNAPYDDNGVLKFPDLSGNDYQVEARRYVSNGNYPNWGNTLTDLQNSLVDIDSLR